MDKKKEVLESLAKWVIRTVDKKELATPEEITALPKVAEVFFNNRNEDGLPRHTKYPILWESSDVEMIEVKGINAGHSERFPLVISIVAFIVSVVGLIFPNL